MTAGQTLNSRLRVLVAKAFRAEKLYSTVNNSRAERLTNMAALAEAASDIRAREWQRSHYQLRTALNDVLGLGNSSAIAREVVGLRDSFLRKSQEATQLVEKGADELVETARRHEFAHIFKISIELIRHKAQAQACKVIADELSSVLDACNPNAVSEFAKSQFVSAKPSLSKAPLPNGVISSLEEIHAETGGLEAMERIAIENAQRSNVVPLKRRFGRQ
ncbi:MAG: hypothetical protein U0136_16805 [Bdellovibrionota bacterium]